MNYLYILNTCIKLEQLRVEAREGNYSDYWDPIGKKHKEGFAIQHIISGYGKKVSDIFSEVLDIECKPRFYILKAGVTLPYHIDRGTQCSFNFVCEGNAPISIQNEGEYVYEQALLNTQIMHGVFNPKQDRVLYKLSIFDYTYEEIKKKYISNVKLINSLIDNI